MKRLLMVTHSAGFRHNYLPLAQEVVKDLGRRSGKFEATATEDCSLLSAESLRTFDGILFATTGELPMAEEDKQALIEAVRLGKGFIGVHNATDTFYKFPPYGEMVGGYFSGHPWTQEAIFVVEDSSHPSTRHLPPAFRVKEEIYTHRNWSRERTHVLVSLDNSSVDLSKGTREDHDYAMAWCHPFGAGRVFYTAFGHFPETWQQLWFQQHLLGGILWALGEEG